MKLLKRSSYISTLAGLLAVGMALNASALVQAQQTSSLLISRLPNDLNFEPPSGLGNPEGRDGGATRGCNQKVSNEQVSNKPDTKALNLIALVPASGIGTTVAEYPTFSWYLPPTDAQQMQFKLLKQKHKNEKFEEIYSTKLTISPNQQRIVSIQLPASAGLSPLEIDQQYNWEVSLICTNNPNGNTNAAIGGAVMRVKAPSNLRVSETIPLRERLALYAKSGYWYDALATIVELRRLYPNDPAIKADWKKLLGSVQLKQTSEDPVVVQSATLSEETEHTGSYLQPTSQSGASGEL